MPVVFRCHYIAKIQLRINCIQVLFTFLVEYLYSVVDILYLSGHDGELRIFLLIVEVYDGVGIKKVFLQADVVCLLLFPYLYDLHKGSFDLCSQSSNLSQVFLFMLKEPISLNIELQLGLFAVLEDLLFEDLMFSVRIIRLLLDISYIFLHLSPFPHHNLIKLLIFTQLGFLVDFTPQELVLLLKTYKPFIILFSHFLDQSQ